jgi:hypothetical protein
VASFDGLPRRSLQVRWGEANLKVAPLPDIIKSKKAAGRPRDLAIIEILEKTLEASAKQKG